MKGGRTKGKKKEVGGERDKGRKERRNGGRAGEREGGELEKQPNLVITMPHLCFFISTYALRC